MTADVEKNRGGGRGVAIDGKRYDKMITKRDTRDQRVLDAIIDYQEEKGQWPTRNQLARELGYGKSDVLTISIRLFNVGAIEVERHVGQSGKTSLILVPLRLDAYPEKAA